MKKYITSDIFHLFPDADDVLQVLQLFRAIYHLVFAILRLHNIWTTGSSVTLKKLLFQWCMAGRILPIDLLEVRRRCWYWIETSIVLQSCDGRKNPHNCLHCKSCTEIDSYPIKWRWFQKVWSNTRNYALMKLAKTMLICQHWDSNLSFTHKRQVSYNHCPNQDNDKRSSC